MRALALPLAGVTLFAACSAAPTRTAPDLAVSEAPPDLAAALTCADPLVPCGGGCVDVQSDARNCGACGTACGPGQACTAGACQCRPGFIDCGEGTCIDVTADPDNCGGCGLACRSGEPDNETCVNSTCRSPCDATAAGMEGCSFFPVNLWSTASVGEFGIVATNPSDTDSAKVTLSDSLGVIASMTAPPRGLAVFRLPQDRNKLDHTEQGIKAFHLVATHPVVAYQFHPIDAALVYTGSSCLLLPEYAMGRDYYAMSYTYNAGIITSPPQGPGYLAVVGLDDGTQVTVTVPVATLAGGTVPAIAPHNKITRTLRRMEVLEIAQANSLEDISGARVHASKRVLVYAGAGTVTVPSDAPGGDHLEVPMFPVTTWGKHFVASKLQQRTTDDVDHYRILASASNTHVTLKGADDVPKLAPINAGGFTEFATASNFEIIADQPIFVMQYIEAWGALHGMQLKEVTTLGDANTTALVPVEQYAKRYVFYVPSTYADNFITVTADLTSGMPANVKLDGKALPAKLTPVGSGNYARAIVPMKEGAHLIEADVPIELLVYGYAQFISYSYVGGGHLDVINPEPPPQ